MTATQTKTTIYPTLTFSAGQSLNFGTLLCLDTSGLQQGWGKRDFIKDLGRGLAVLTKTERAEGHKENLFFNPSWVTAGFGYYCC